MKMDKKIKQSQIYACKNNECVCMPCKKVEDETKITKKTREIERRKENLVCDVSIHHYDTVPRHYYVQKGDASDLIQNTQLFSKFSRYSIFLTNGY